MIATPASVAFEAPHRFPESDAGDWFVLHTKSRQEKAIAETLSAMGIAHFLPFIKRVRYYGRRKFTVEFPLFPGYVFLRGTRSEAFESNRTHRVANVLSVHDQERLDFDLRNLFRAIEINAPLDPYAGLIRGRHVVIRSGPFRGIHGIVDERTRADRLILQINFLGRAAALETDAALLDPVDHVVDVAG
jgi:transcription antitermination factor NusG